MGWLPVLRLGLPQQLSPCRDDFSRSDDHIGHLETEAGPGALALAAPMDADDAVADFDIGHRWILPDDLPAEDRGVEFHRSSRVRSPDDVFESFDVHGRDLTDVWRSGNEEMAFSLAIRNASLEGQLLALLLFDYCFCILLPREIGQQSMLTEVSIDTFFSARDELQLGNPN